MGRFVGASVGLRVGGLVGASDGILVGFGVGASVGILVGRAVATVGALVGAFVGARVVGALVGLCVGGFVAGARVGAGDKDGSAVMDGAKLGLGESLTVTCCSPNTRLGAGVDESVGATGARIVGVIGMS